MKSIHLIVFKRWKIWMTQGMIGLILIGLVILASFAAFSWSHGLIALLPADSGAKTEAIVVLGRGPGYMMQSRIDAATQLWREGRSPQIFVSGEPEADEMIQLLLANQVPLQNIEGEACSLSTEENALYTAAILQPKGIWRIILVTDEPHLVRSFLTFRSLGFNVIPHATPIPPDWDRKKRVKLARKEYLGLIGYALIGRYHRRSFDESRYLGARKLDKIQDKGCLPTLKAQA